MPNYDIYGNVDRYALYLDLITGEQHWYPDTYKNHPVYGIRLRLVNDPDDAKKLLYPSSKTYPSSSTYTVKSQNLGAVFDVPRPLGMHGIGTGNGRVLVVPESLIFYPSDAAYPANDLYPE